VVGSAISGNTISRHQHQDREVNIESTNWESVLTAFVNKPRLLVVNGSLI
jgi:hypothetical protein